MCLTSLWITKDWQVGFELSDTLLQNPITLQLVESRCIVGCGRGLLEGRNELLWPSSGCADGREPQGLNLTFVLLPCWATEIMCKGCWTCWFSSKASVQQDGYLFVSLPNSQRLWHVAKDDLDIFTIILPSWSLNIDYFIFSYFSSISKIWSPSLFPILFVFHSKESFSLNLVEDEEAKYWERMLEMSAYNLSMTIMFTFSSPLTPTAFSFCFFNKKKLFYFRTVLDLHNYCESRVPVYPELSSPVINILH